MDQVNFKQNAVAIDPSLIDIMVDSTGLVIQANYLTTGAPVANAGLYQPMAIVTDSDGVRWQNVESTAAPVFNSLPVGVGPGSITGPMIADSARVYTDQIDVSSAEILALNGTPKQLVAAPGAGKFIQVLSVTDQLIFGSAAYATHTELDVIDTSLGTILFKDTATLLAAVATKIAQIPANINANAGLAISANGAVELKAATGNPATGDGTLKILISYKIVTIV